VTDPWSPLSKVQTAKWLDEKTKNATYFTVKSWLVDRDMDNNGWDRINPPTHLGAAQKDNCCCRKKRNSSSESAPVDLEFCGPQKKVCERMVVDPYGLMVSEIRRSPVDMVNKM